MVGDNAAEYEDKQDQLKDRQIQDGDQAYFVKKHWTTVEMIKQWPEIYQQIRSS